VITADSNIFIYAIDVRYPGKQAVAAKVLAVLETARQVIPLQVIGEFQNVAVRKLKLPRAFAASLAAETLTTFETFPVSRSSAKAALAEMAAARLSYWDALMLASAAEAGCTVMLSEDMQDGARIFGVEIVNPFGAEGVSPRAAELLELA